MVGFLLLGIGLGASGLAGASSGGLRACVLAFAAVVACDVRLSVLSIRGGRLAAAHPAEQFGHPVPNHGLRVSHRWWQALVARDGTTRPHEIGRPRS